MSNLSKWRVWCITDSKYEYSWKDTSLPGPVTCPVDSGHTIDVSKTAIVDSVSTQIVKLDSNVVNIVEIQEVSPGALSYRSFTIPRISIAAGDQVGSSTKSWPYDYHMISIGYWGGNGSNAEIGDNITCEIDSDRNLTTLIGAYGELQVAETTLDDEVLVSSYAIGQGLLQPGCFVKFAANSNPEYEIISIDTVTNKIKLDRVLDNYRSAGDDIFRTITMGSGISVMPSSAPVIFGASKVGASRIPAGWEIKVTYTKTAGDTTNVREIDIVTEGGLLAV